MDAVAVRLPAATLSPDNGICGLSLLLNLKRF